MLGHTPGYFFITLTVYKKSAVVSIHFMLFGGNLCLIWRSGYGSRFFYNLPDNAKSNIDMKAITSKAGTMPQIVTAATAMMAGCIRWFSSHALTIGVMSAAAAFFGCLAQSEILIYSAAAIGLLSLYPFKKGGER